MKYIQHRKYEPWISKSNLHVTYRIFIILNFKCISFNPHVKFAFVTTWNMLYSSLYVLNWMCNPVTQIWMNVLLHGCFFELIIPEFKETKFFMRKSVSFFKHMDYSHINLPRNSWPSSSSPRDAMMTPLATKSARSSHSPEERFDRIWMSSGLASNFRRNSSAPGMLVMSPAENSASNSFFPAKTHLKSPVIHPVTATTASRVPVMWSSSGSSTT